MSHVNLQVLALILAFFANSSAGIFFYTVIYLSLSVYICIFFKINIVGKGISVLLVKKLKLWLFALELTKKTNLELFARII